MKNCPECGVKVKDLSNICPLCKGALCGEIDKSATSAYPQSFLRKKSYGLVKRILIFLSVIAGITCLFINYVNPEPLWWSLIVITSLIYAWVVIPHALRRGGNFAGKIFTQVICAIALVVILDFQIGWRAWSVNYVVPMMLCTGIASIALIVAINSTNWAQYVMYQILLALFGFVPIILHCTGVSHNAIFALITCAFALVTLIAMFVFGDRSIKNEFKRRLRF